MLPFSREDDTVTNPFEQPAARSAVSAGLDADFRRQALRATWIGIGLATLPALLGIGALCSTWWLALMVLGVGGVAWARGDAIHRSWSEHMPPWGLWAIRGTTVASTLFGLFLIALPFVLLALVDG